jgi:hypothetical protein
LLGERLINAFEQAIELLEGQHPPLVPVTETRFDIFVIFDSLFQLAHGFRMEVKAHSARPRQILANTSSPGTHSTAPERTSFKRFAATVAHFSSILDSGEFRLQRSESITSTLSSTGKASAS